MGKKIVIFFIIIILFSYFHIAFADLSINEIMYDLSGSDTTGSKSREWIEIYNSAANAIVIDASKWRIFDGSANRTINGEVDFSVPAGGYVIFAGDKDTFLVDHPGFGGTVYDTGITSLNNTGATLKILDQNLNSVDSVTYASTDGGAGDGNSLQKISGSWAGATPTPGATNAVASPSSTAVAGAGGLTNSNPISGSLNTQNTPAQTAQTTNGTAAKAKTADGPKIQTQIVGKTLVFAGIPFELQANATGLSGERLMVGKYFWNFGDGDSKEVKISDSQKFNHTYFYEGDYTVSLEYYQNYYSETSDAIDRVSIKVVPANILISRVGDERDFFVELLNNTDYDADISSWHLSSSGKSFILPRNTVIQSKKKIIISSIMTGFSTVDKDTLKLITPQGNTIFDYSSLIVPTAVPSANETKVEPDVTLVNPNDSKNSIAITVKSKQPAIHLNDENKIPTVSAPVAQIVAENLLASPNLAGSASAIQSDALKDDSVDRYFNFVSLISVIFIASCAGTVYLIRRKKSVVRAGDDFNILDE